VGGRLGEGSREMVCSELGLWEGFVLRLRWVVVRSQS
jgi:hypothetical protein